jgi:ribosome recycling factor
MLDGIMVSYYGATSPLNQVSSMTTPDARTIFIKPWEKNLIQEIERAIMNANLGLNPQNDGQQVIINIPMLTEERRRQLVKQVGAECEHGKVSIRSIRKEINELLKKVKGVSEDDVKNAEDKVQKFTDEYINKIDALMKKKEAEIMTV